MVKLIPMTPPEFTDFFEHSIRDYAEERTRAGYWSEAEALTRSRKEHKALLPDGLKSRYHHLYTDSGFGDRHSRWRVCGL